MSLSLSDRYYAVLASKTAGKAASAVEIVDSVLEAARKSGASDVHLIPIESSLEVHWRIDGVLHAIETLREEISANVVFTLANVIHDVHHRLCERPALIRRDIHAIERVEVVRGQDGGVHDLCDFGS